MGKRKVKVEAKPQQPKMVSDHSVPNNATLDKLGRDTVYLMLRNASKAIDRLRAEVAAKDAEITRLKGVEPSPEPEPPKSKVRIVADKLAQQLFDSGAFSGQQK